MVFSLAADLKVPATPVIQVAEVWHERSIRVKWYQPFQPPLCYHAVWLCVDGTDDWLVYDKTGLRTDSGDHDLAATSTIVTSRLSRCGECIINGLSPGSAYWISVAARGPGGWSEYASTASAIILEYARPSIVTPLPTPSRKRPAPKGCHDLQSKRCKIIFPSVLPCSWPGCPVHFCERRLDCDMEAYTEQDFVDNYAPVTGLTVRWKRAPHAAQYCKEHIAARVNFLHTLGCNWDQAELMAGANWFHMHPETDHATVSALERWLDASKDLYLSLHPKKDAADLKLRINGVYCFSNKEETRKNANGKDLAHRWTYDPTNAVGQLASNRKLLVHGSAPEKILEIMDQDLKLAGVEIKSTNGQMLGSGVYVADTFMKSLQYVTSTSVNGRRTKHVFLLEVNIGKPFVCSRVEKFTNQFGIQDSRIHYEQGKEVTRQGITFARGLAFFTGSKQLRSGWAQGCRVPIAPSKVKSEQPCARVFQLPTGSQSKDIVRPLKFNEWCLHDTQCFRIRYIVRLQE